MTNTVSTSLAPISRFPEALCREVDPELFFSDKGYSTKPAKTICEQCVEKDACLEEALANRDYFGVRGGKSERERRVLLKERANV